MSAVFVRATALACALGPDLETALGRLRGEPLAPERNTRAGGAWPYFAIPAEGGDWAERASAIARTVADALRREARLSRKAWAALPCLVGSSSHSVGAWDENGEAALQPPLEFCRMLARDFGVRGPMMLANTACTSGLSALDLALGLIATGRCRDALVIGVELANRLTVAGFAGLELLSATRARPCDRERDGLVLGEALGAVLVSAGSGRWRIASFASGIDAASLTGPAPSGEVILDT
ncbi:MAG: beta-ketoacyl synthase N-terminal-like domain-containing protein, partial [Burkholderiales bacterium]